jgi:hypothetical protein
MSLDPIRKRKKIAPFAVYDIETTTDLKRVYLVGFYDGRDYRVFESEPLPPENPKSAMVQFLRWYFAKPTRRPIYAHNGGNFDQVFSLAAIIAQFREQSLEIIPSNSSILMMKVKDKHEHTWTFLDSARTLPDSLDNLAKCFLNRSKMTEGIDYETLHTNPLRYDYLKTDCVLLYDTLSEFFRLLYDRLRGQAGISAASTALATFRSGYQRRPLPEISEHAARLARAGYYGGRCEPFRREFGRQEPSGRRIDYKGLPLVLHDYDVNSMYPWAMRQPQPIEELQCLKGCHLELTGFVDATIEVQKCHVPILPCRTENKLLFPYGKWRGVFSTAELRLAEATRQLQRIRVHEACYFKTAPVFAEYVDTLYQFRDKSNPNWSLALDRMAKLCANSLYGKFGSQETRETIHIRPTFDAMVDRQMQQIPSTLGNVDAYIERTTTKAAYMLPQISAWITALGRCRLAEGLLDAGEDVYYCDTDAIFTPGSVRPIGRALGEWKDEHRTDPIVYAYFLAPKVYVLRHASGSVTNRAKGFARFGTKNPLPPDLVAILASGEAINVSRFSKARSVIRGDFGLITSQKRCHLKYEKRIFHEDGSSEPRRVDLA